MNRTDLQNITHSNILDTDIKGFPKFTDYEILTKEYITRKILNGMQYRPDKIAEYYLGDSNYAWAIYFANGFTNGIRDFRLGRTIKIPNIERLQ